MGIRCSLSCDLRSITNFSLLHRSHYSSTKIRSHYCSTKIRSHYSSTNIVATTLAYSNGKCGICSEHSHTPFTLALQQLSQPFGLPQTSVLTFYMACLPGVGRLAFMQPTRRMSVVSAITYFCWRSKISLPTFDSWGMLVIVVPSLWDCTMSVTICVLPTSLMLAGDRRRRV